MICRFFSRRSSRARGNPRRRKKFSYSKAYADKRRGRIAGKNRFVRKRRFNQSGGKTVSRLQPARAAAGVGLRLDHRQSLLRAAPLAGKISCAVGIFAASAGSVVTLTLRRLLFVELQCLSAGLIGSDSNIIFSLLNLIFGFTRQHRQHTRYDTHCTNT